MKNHNQNPRYAKLHGIIQKINIFNLDYNRVIDSLRAISRVTFAFFIIIIATLFVQLLRIDSGNVQHFKLLLPNAGVDILPLYKTHFTGFVFLVLYELAKVAILSFMFLCFFRFLNTLDWENPFKNPISKTHILRVAYMSTLFFAVDTIGSIHLRYFEEALGLANQLRLFHVEFLLLMYFINVFAFIFKKGVDLNNEIELVI